MKWAEKQRHEFIDKFIKEKGYINRSDICDMFDLSTPQASIDLRKWLENNPNKLKYNLQTRRYELKDKENE